MAVAGLMQGTAPAVPQQMLAPAGRRDPEWIARGAQMHPTTVREVSKLMSRALASASTWSGQPVRVQWERTARPNRQSTPSTPEILLLVINSFGLIIVLFPCFPAEIRYLQP